MTSCPAKPDAAAERVRSNDWLDGTSNTIWIKLPLLCIYAEEHEAATRIDLEPTLDCF